MGNCKYCGIEVGFLRTKHKECEAKNKSGKELLRKSLTDFFSNSKSIELVKVDYQNICDTSFINVDDGKFIVHEILIEKVKNVVKNGLVIIDEIKKINELKTKFSLGIEFESNTDTKLFKNLIVDSISNDISSKVLNSELDLVFNDFQEIITSIALGNEEIKRVKIRSFEKIIDNILEDDLIDVVEETKLVDFREKFTLEQSELNESESNLKLIKSLILRDTLNGKLSTRVRITNQIPFILQKKESIIWLANNVDYYEDKIRREYVGGSHGASIRIAKGLYYRVSAFKGSPVDTIEKVFKGTGILGFTNKHIYFTCGNTSFRIKYDKIISVSPNSDGFTILKDGARALPQTFRDGDGWFSYNLINNLSQLDIN